MRRLERNRVHADEEESVFVTMTDMTISFLLIIMILLAFFATLLNEGETVETIPRPVYERVRQERDDLRVENQILIFKIKELEDELNLLRAQLNEVTSERDRLQSELDQLSSENKELRSRVADLEQQNDQLKFQIDQFEIEIDQLQLQIEHLVEEIERLRNQIARLRLSNPLEAYLSEAIDKKRELLVELRDRLKIEFPDLKVEISPEQDALRFQGEGLFRSGSSRLESRQRQIVETMGSILDEILICFTLGNRAERGPNCESGHALIEAVQIEGHTDSDGDDLENLGLSTKRANETLRVMLNKDRGILAHQNLRQQPVMSVSGYGEMRPIESNETREGKGANRRIDLRIIMYAPSTVQEVEEVGRQLDALRDSGDVE